MSKYAMVSADFPDVTSTQRDKIYICLGEKKWHKFKNLGRDISTTWWAHFDDDFTESEIISTSVSEFKECSKPYTVPLLVVHVGPNKPKEY